MVVRTIVCAGNIGLSLLLFILFTALEHAKNFGLKIGGWSYSHPLLSVALAGPASFSLLLVGSVYFLTFPIQMFMLALSAPFVIIFLILIACFQAEPFVATFEYCCPEVIWRSRRTSRAGDRQAALTIDDVPLLKSPSSLEEILDVLKEFNVKATFMVMSGFVEAEDDIAKRYMTLLKRAVAEGHELGNHNKFDEPAASLTDKEFKQKLKHCDDLISSIYGEQQWREQPLKWHRPGSGFWTPQILSGAKAMDYTTVLANCFPNDVCSWTRIFNAPYLKLRARPGSIILLHDRWHTPSTLRAALPYLTQHLDLVTLSDLKPTDGLEKQQ